MNQCAVDMIFDDNIFIFVAFWFFNILRMTVVCHSLSILYAVFAASNWIAPSVVFLLGPKWSLLVGACTYWLVSTITRKFMFFYSL